MESPIAFMPTLLYFASFLLLLFPHSSTTASAQFLETVCNKTKSNPECLKLLKADPRTATATNYKELAPIAFELAIQYVKQSEALATNLNDTSPNEAVKQCANAYESVELEFKIGETDASVDGLTANYDVKIADDGVISCETALKAKGVEIPAITERNRVLHLYCNILDVITNSLKA